MIMMMIGRYVHGFGDPAAEFWLGLDKLKQLTRSASIATTILTMVILMMIILVMIILVMTILVMTILVMIILTIVILIMIILVMMIILILKGGSAAEN